MQAVFGEAVSLIEILGVGFKAKVVGVLILLCLDLVCGFDFGKFALFAGFQRFDLCLHGRVHVAGRACPSALGPWGEFRSIDARSAADSG